MVRIKWVGMCSVLRSIPGTPAPFLNLVLSSVSSPSSFQQPSTAKKEWEHPPYLWSQCKTSPSKILVCGVGSQQVLVVHTACNRGPGESPAAPHCLQHPHFGLGAYAKSETLSFLLDSSPCPLYLQMKYFAYPVLRDTNSAEMNFILRIASNTILMCLNKMI